MRAGLLLWLLLSGLPSSAQNPLPAARESSFILRLQRQDFRSEACVLLQANGNYHLEESRRRSVVVFEGTLSKEQLGDVSRWLNDPTLLHFSQNDVVVPLISRQDDQIQINILRSDHWQWLEFPDVESRKPLSASLDPLLSWLKNLAKQPARERSEDEGKNNCLPPGQIALKRRPDAKLENSAPAPKPAPAANAPQASYLLRFETDRYGPGTANRECIVVYPDGRYHAERSYQTGHSDMASRVYEQKLDEPAIASLQELLEDSKLKSMRKGNLPDEGQANEITLLWIPRSQGSQQLRFAANFEVWEGRRRSSVSNDPGAKIADPIKEWVKTEFQPSKSILLKNRAATNCQPR